MVIVPPKQEKPLHELSDSEILEKLEEIAAVTALTTMAGWEIVKETIIYKQSAIAAALIRTPAQEHEHITSLQAWFHAGNEFLSIPRMFAETTHTFKEEQERRKINNSTNTLDIFSKREKIK